MLLIYIVLINHYEVSTSLASTISKSLPVDDLCDDSDSLSDGSTGVTSIVGEESLKNIQSYYYK